MNKNEEEPVERISKSYAALIADLLKKQGLQEEFPKKAFGKKKEAPVVDEAEEKKNKFDKKNISDDEVDEPEDPEVEGKPEKEENPEGDTDKAVDNEEDLPPYKGPPNHPALADDETQEEPTGLTAKVMAMIKLSHQAAGNITLTGEPMNKIILEPPLKMEEKKAIKAVLDLLDEDRYHIGGTGYGYKTDKGKVNVDDPIARKVLGGSRVRVASRTTVKQATMKGKSSIVKSRETSSVPSPKSMPPSFTSFLGSMK